MKAELSLQNKLKFFSQYALQKSLLYKDQLLIVDSNIYNPEVLENSQLLLKPLSSISDEDKQVICKILDLEYSEDTTYGFENFFISNQKIESYPSDDSVDFDLECYDYLRSKGYALPWMGLSVQEIVEAEWIKLIES